MRIISRSESPSFPPLETLLPMEKSWALEVEKEEEVSCVHSGKHKHSDRSIVSEKQKESIWVSRKRLNSGSKEEEASHRSHQREYELCCKSASIPSDSKPCRNDKHSSSRNSEESRGAWHYTSSSRSYPAPSVHIRSSKFSVVEERRASRCRTGGSVLHEARKSTKPNRTSDISACRQHSTRSGYQSFSKIQAVKSSANMVGRREDHFVHPIRRTEVTSIHEASVKDIEHADGLLHRQDHQQLGEYTHGFQSSFDKNSQYEHCQYSAQGGLSEQRNKHGYVRKIGLQGPLHGVTDRKNAKICGRSIKSEVTQLSNAKLMEQNFKEKPRVLANEGSEFVTTTEGALSDGLSMSCTEELEVQGDDSTGKSPYEMLACLLFDDIQGMDSGLDPTTLVIEKASDHECTASIFDDVLEASMDIAILEEKDDMSGKGPAACHTKRPDYNSRRVPVGKNSASESAKKQHNASGFSLSGLKQSSSVLVDVTNKFEIYASPGVKGPVEEDDAHRIGQRQRQIDFGKNTLGYERYCELIPRTKRKSKDPQTPNPKQVCSKRSWDGQIRKWRRLLHVYDPPSEAGEEIAEDFSILKLNRSNLEEKGPNAREDTSPGIIRDSEADESKGCVAADRKIVEDANLTIYDDWMEM